jgi:predicted site-specific integrase-resolvase
MSRLGAMEILVRPTNKGWCKPSQGARYAGVSLKQFRGWLRNGLDYSQLPNGRILVRYEAIDRYLEQFRVEDEVKRTARELIENL